MKLKRYILWSYLYLQYWLYRITGKGPFSKGSVTYLEAKMNGNDNKLKKALHRHHVKQYHDASCSVATVVSVVNAILDSHKKINGTPLTQFDLLEKVKSHNWKERMDRNGYKGKRGLPLKVLGDVVRDSLDCFDIKYRSVETVQAGMNPEKSKAVREILLKRLKGFEKKGDCLIIAHFNQGIFVRTIQLPHISPVGGFDPETSEVTILDVDPSQQNPYRISFDRFYDGISNDYNNLFKTYGYGSGGYIFVELN